MCAFRQAVQTRAQSHRRTLDLPVYGPFCFLLLHVLAVANWTCMYSNSDNNYVPVRINALTHLAECASLNAHDCLWGACSNNGTSLQLSAPSPFPCPAKSSSGGYCLQAYNTLNGELRDDVWRLSIDGD